VLFLDPIASVCLSLIQEQNDSPRQSCRIDAEHAGRLAAVDIHRAV